MSSSFTNSRSLKSLLVSGCAALALASLSSAPQMALAQQGSGAGNQAQGAQSGGNVQNRQGANAGGGGSQGLGGIFRSLPSEGSGTSIETQIFRGKGERVIIIIEEDDGDDSDRPDWAGVPGGEGRPGGGGNPNPGTVKGDIFGDLIVLYRDPATGEPILDAEGELQFCEDVACESYVSMVDGEVPDGYTAIEVEFGRASVARSPDTVTDRALEEALDALTADGVVIDTDAAGRITYTLDGVTISTIDSPLENLALYIQLSEELAFELEEEPVSAALGDLATLETAAALFAAVADKTGDITLDYLVYQNVITGVELQGEFYDYSSFTYDREDYPTVPYNYYDTDGVTILSSFVDLSAYLEDENGALPDGEAALFAAAADDALEVIELLHTQIHPGILVGDTP